MPSDPTEARAALQDVLAARDDDATSVRRYAAMATAFLARHGDSVLIALAALPDDGREGLDVERLARALNASVGTRGWLRATPSDSVTEWRVNAEVIAAEYAALGAGSTDEVRRLRAALEIIAAEPTDAPWAIGVRARNIARAALTDKPGSKP